MSLRPRKLANKFNISPSTLRNYEAKGLIPPAMRSANGYRMYTEQHEAYLACIQAMAPSFGMEVTSEVLHCLQRNELDDALWIVREREVMLYQDKVNLDQLVGELRSYADGSQPYELIEHFNIHEVSKRTGVAKSAIRYWEKSGMFNTERNPDNDYRLYNKSHLLKIKMIQVLNSSVYSEDTVSLKQSIAELDLNYIDKAVTLVENIKIHQNKTIKSQLGGLSYLYELFLSLGGLEK